MHFNNHVLRVVHRSRGNGKRGHGNFKQENFCRNNFHKTGFLFNKYKDT